MTEIHTLAEPGADNPKLPEKLSKVYRQVRMGEKRSRGRKEREEMSRGEDTSFIGLTTWQCGS